MESRILNNFSNSRTIKKNYNYQKLLQQAENEFYSNFHLSSLDNAVIQNQTQNIYLKKVNMKSSALHKTLGYTFLPKIGIWNYEVGQKRVSWSPEVNEIFGLPEGTTPSVAHFIDILHPDDRIWVIESFEQSAEKKDELYLSFRIINDKGEVKHLFAQSKIVINEDGNRVGYFGILHDITERKKIEAVNERLLHVIKYSRDEIYLFNAKSLKFEFLNEGALSNSGYSLEEMQKMTPVDIKPDYNTREYRKLIRPLINKNVKRLVFETIHKRKDGSTYPVEVHLQMIEQEIGNVCMAIVLDITDRKKTEKEIRKSHDLLEYQNSQLVDFCNIVSHNLRSPMSNMTMLIEAIEESDNDEDKALYISKLKPVINNLHETFDELVESLQVRQDLEIKSEELDLEEVVKKHLDGLEGQITMLDAKIKLDFSEASKITYPSKYLSSILHNLLSNALKYKSPQRKPLIKLKTVRKANSIILMVKDNGLGIDLDKHQNNIFKIRKVFHKNPDAKGFGLFLTKTQIDAMGGKIWVESTPGKGSTFFVEFVHQ